MSLGDELLGNKIQEANLCANKQNMKVHLDVVRVTFANQKVDILKVSEVNLQYIRGAQKQRLIVCSYSLIEFNGVKRKDCKNQQNREVTGESKLLWNLAV